MEQQKPNCLRIALETQQVTFADVSLSDEVINNRATILANILLDYVKNVGSTKEITPSKVFNRRDT